MGVLRAVSPRQQLTPVGPQELVKGRPEGPGALGGPGSLCPVDLAQVVGTSGEPLRGWLLTCGMGTVCCGHLGR